MTLNRSQRRNDRRQRVIWAVAELVGTVVVGVFRVAGMAPLIFQLNCSISINNVFWLYSYFQRKAVAET